MSRNTAAVLGGVLGGTMLSAVMTIVAYLIVGSLSWGNVAPAVLSGLVFAVLYARNAMRSGR